LKKKKKKKILETNEKEEKKTKEESKKILDQKNSELEKLKLELTTVSTNSVEKDKKIKEKQQEIESLIEKAEKFKDQHVKDLELAKTVIETNFLSELSKRDDNIKTITVVNKELYDQYINSSKLAETLKDQISKLTSELTTSKDQTNKLNLELKDKISASKLLQENIDQLEKSKQELTQKLEVFFQRLLKKTTSSSFNLLTKKNPYKNLNQQFQY